MIGTIIISAFNWYGFLIGSGMLLGIVAAYYLAKTRGYNEDLVFFVAIICIPCAIVGARIYYIIFDDKGSDFWTFKRIIGLEDGGMQGLAIYGGVLAAMLGSIIVWQIFRKKENPLDRITILQMFDLFFIFILFGQAVGRWGNFANQEAHGNLITNPSHQWFPLAVKIGDSWYQATFFYESMLNFIGCGIMLWLYMGKRKSFDGFVFAFYGIWYGTARVCIEALRTDSLMVGGVRVSQIVSILFLISGVAIIASHLVLAWRKQKKVFILVSLNRLTPQHYGYEQSRVWQPKRVYERKKK